MAFASGTSVKGVQTLLEYPASDRWVLLNLSSLPRTEVRRQGYLSIVRPYDDQNLDLEVNGTVVWMQGVALDNANGANGRIKG